jgi:hypothetical protein
MGSTQIMAPFAAMTVFFALFNTTTEDVVSTILQRPLLLPRAALSRSKR